MEKSQIKEVKLNSGNMMPLIGMGTGGILPPTEILTSALNHAIEIGYRHFDTAAMYGSEEALGRAVAEALHRGLIKNREEIFITSKLSFADTHPDLVLQALKKTLQKLGLEYVDLYLIHWPVRIKHDADLYKFKEEDMLPFELRGTWEAMEECSKLGLAKAIGVSNFSTKKLSQLLQHATIPPAVNQVEMNVAWQQKKLLEYCKEKGIHVCAYSPLSANGAAWGSLAVMESPVLQEIAAAKGKSVPQIALRWIYEQGVCPIVRSFNKERMANNLKILDWELTEEDLQKIEQIPQRRGCNGEMFVYENGPYKSLKELWDEDE